MPEKQIYLYREEETIFVEGAIPFVCTPNFKNSMSKYGLVWNNFAQYMYHNKVFLFLKSYGNFIDILMNDYILACALADDHIVLKHLTRKSIQKHNQFIRHSFKLTSTQGSVLWNTPDQSTNRFDWDRAKMGFVRIIPVLNQLDINPSSNQGGEDQNVDELSDDQNDRVNEDFEELEKILNIAEYYNEAEDEIQRSITQSSYPIGYYNFETSTDFTRVEKIAYTFYISDYDKNRYRKGSRVEIIALNDDRLTGTIVEIMEETEENPAKITILFDTKFDVQNLSPAGNISLEYNPIQKLVREEVINSIREGTSRAKYFSKIVKRDAKLTFEQNDLSAVMNRLNESKYPPNASQLEAIKKGIQANEMLLVLGPPGTGKTTVILEWVRYFVKEQRKRVLISSQNNKAVDNVLERLSKEQGIETIRVGSEEKVQSNIHHLMFERKSYELQQKISNSTQKHLEYLQQDQSLLNHYISTVKQALDNLQNLESKKKNLQEMYNSIIETQISPMKKIYSDFKKATSNLDKSKRKIDSLVNWVAEYGTYSKFKKGLLLPLFKINMYRLRKNHEKYHHILLDEKRYIKEYNHLYENIKNELSSAEFNQAKKNVVHLQTQHAELQNLLKDGVTFKSYLPSIMYEEQEKASQSLQNLWMTCQTKMKQIVLMNQAIHKWNHYLSHKQNFALAQVLLDSVDLVGATCIGINSQPRFKDIEFDVTIIDEAGQIQIHNAIVPMSRSPKVIMLGDHLQIPPIKDTLVEKRCEEAGIDSSFLDTSFFEYLYRRAPEENKILLDTQYRMPSEIADVLSKWFYEGKYKSFQNKVGLKSVIPSVFNHPFVILSTSDHPLRHEKRVPGEGYINPFESDLIINILQQIFDTTRFKPEDIGIITPYKLQVNYIRKRVSEKFPELSSSQVNDLIASLDSFQGQERPIILYSCTRSNTKKPNEARIGFLKELRRLNVALSRCQQQLIFIGDTQFFIECEYEVKDEYGNVIVDEEGNVLQGTSEKEFANFIKLILSTAEAGHAQFVSSRELLKKLGNQVEVHHE